jgi:hypothetical protein
MTPAIEAELLKAVRELRLDMGRRFVFINKRLDGICIDVSTLERDRDVARGVAEALQAQSTEHTLSFRWRIGIALAAAAGLGALFLNILHFIVPS